MTEDHQDNKEENNTGKEQEDTRVYAEIVKTINNLPNDHYAWGYQDPTRTYYGGEHNEGQQGRNDFISCVRILVLIYSDLNFKLTVLW